MLQTNTPFLLNVLENKRFLDGTIDTYFIDEHPDLFKFKPSLNRAQRLLQYLGNVMVNGPQTPLATNLMPSEADPKIPDAPGLRMFCQAIMLKMFVRQILSNMTNP